MKTKVYLLVMLFSMLGAQPSFAQVADSVSFQITNVPTRQGKVLLSTENGKYFEMRDAVDSIVQIKLNNIPYEKYKVYVFHDANGNWQLDKSVDNTPIEYCAIHEIDVTANRNTFKN